MNKQEDIKIRRFFEWSENMRTRSCKNCQWGGYEKGDIMVTCGHNLENFTPNSSCGAWTSPDDVDLLEQRAEVKKRLMKKLNK